MRLGHKQGGQCNSLRNVAAFWLEYIANPRWVSHFVHLFMCAEEVVLVGYDRYFICAAGLPL